MYLLLPQKARRGICSDHLLFGPGTIGSQLLWRQGGCLTRLQPLGHCDPVQQGMGSCTPSSVSPWKNCTETESSTRRTGREVPHAWSSFAKALEWSCSTPPTRGGEGGEERERGKRAATRRWDDGNYEPCKSIPERMESYLCGWFKLQKDISNNGELPGMAFVCDLFGNKEALCLAKQKGSE